MAAGLTVRRDRFDALGGRLNAMLLDSTSAARARAGLEFDGALTPAAVTNDLIDLIERAGPYGQGNPQPRFAFPAHRVKFSKVMGEAHVRVHRQHWGPVKCSWEHPVDDIWVALVRTP